MHRDLIGHSPLYYNCKKAILNHYRECLLSDAMICTLMVITISVFMKYNHCIK